jgi:hypothetical protein
MLIYDKLYIHTTFYIFLRWATKELNNKKKGRHLLIVLMVLVLTLTVMEIRTFG